MSLLTVSHLSKSFGPVDIFSGVTVSVPRNARIALVGPNGVGKTTLLRILTGEEEPSSGKVHRARGLTIGHLPQEAELSASHSLWEECLSAFSGLRAREAELAALEATMADPAQAEDAIARYGPLQEDFERRGGYTYETRIRQTLAGLGFDPGDYHRPLSQLSGGQRTRAFLAQLLLSDPDLLVLDEPTNHLDISAVEWLENYLNGWDGTVVLVSHDRYFLDKVVNTIWEMSRSGIETYRGNYSAYLHQRQERWERRRQIFEAEKSRLEKELDYIKRNIAGQRTQQARGRLRRLSRQVEAIESLGVQALQDKSWSEISSQADISDHTMGVAEVERRIRGLKGPLERPAILKMKLKTDLRSGDIVLRTSQLKVGYPGEPLFTTDDIELHRLECAAVIGPNGAGKTTFLKTVLGQRSPLEGEVWLGASLQIGYFAQAHEDLNSERTLVEEIEAVAPNLLVAEIRNYLARFLFSGEDVFRRVSTLSGGERGRMALAKLALVNANLLLLDEPTNHLDVPSQEILQQVLADYEGTILLVSHDRYLIDALATQIWEIDQEGQSLRIFKGSYSEYRAQKDSEPLKMESVTRETIDEHKSLPKSRLTNNDRRRLARLRDVEEQIASLETRMAELVDQLENPSPNPELVQQLGEEYVQVQDEIYALLTEWEKLQ